MRYSWTIFGVLLLFATPLVAAQKTVQLKVVKLRKSPTLFAPSASELSYLDEVKVLEDKKGWSRVVAIKNKKLAGWVQTVALSNQAPLQIKEAGQVKLSDGAVTLAGKGFSSQHEQAMKQKDQKLDFSRVDQVERIEVSDAAFKAFVGAGAFKTAKKRGSK
jgi:hypothetical protein